MDPRITRIKQIVQFSPSRKFFKKSNLGKPVKSVDQK